LATVRTTILHVITGLAQGGAERNLFNLVTHGDPSRYRHVVAPLRDGGFWRDEMLRAGVELMPLRWNRAWDSLQALARLRRVIAETQPSIVQSWLYHADLAAALITPRAVPLLWTLRNSDPRASGRYRALLRLLAALSQRPDLVISNSERGLADHVALGYRPRRSAIVANGIDVERFKPMPRAEARARLGLSTDGMLIGMAARVDPFKDHANFLSAARIARDAGYQGAFVLAGADVEALRADNVICLGALADMPAFYAALDVATLSSSHGEGFPNAIAEAMACGVPVVATDVGDTADVLGQGGIVVAPCDARALARGWLDMTQLSASAREAIGGRGRARVVERFALGAMIAAFEWIYDELADVSSNK
jgi:glycosyltransferase involved in cell wall biosynthesis